MKEFLACILNIGIIKKPTTASYWSPLFPSHPMVSENVYKTSLFPLRQHRRIVRNNVFRQNGYNDRQISNALDPLPRTSQPKEEPNPAGSIFNRISQVLS